MYVGPTRGAQVRELLVNVRGHFFAYIVRGWRQGEYFQVIFYQQWTYVETKLHRDVDVAAFRHRLETFIDLHRPARRSWPLYNRRFLFALIVILSLLTIGFGVLVVLSIAGVSPRRLMPEGTALTVCAAVVALVMFAIIQTAPGSLRIEGSPAAVATPNLNRDPADRGRRTRRRGEWRNFLRNVAYALVFTVGAVLQAVAQALSLSGRANLIALVFVIMLIGLFLANQVAPDIRVRRGEEALSRFGRRRNRG